eukprot:1177219-Prorocentrum_minimum.AAC.2
MMQLRARTKRVVLNTMVDDADNDYGDYDSADDDDDADADADDNYDDGSALAEVDGAALAEDGSRALAEDDGSALAEVDGDALAEVDGDALAEGGGRGRRREEEGSALAEDDGSALAEEDGQGGASPRTPSVYAIRTMHDFFSVTTASDGSRDNVPRQRRTVNKLNNSSSSRNVSIFLRSTRKRR